MSDHPRKPTLKRGAYDIVLDGKELVILGDPTSTEDEETDHNCDAMGCGQEHVVIRAKITHIDAALAAAPPSDSEQP